MNVGYVRVSTSDQKFDLLKLTRCFKSRIISREASHLIIN